MRQIRQSKRLGWRSVGDRLAIGEIGEDRPPTLIFDWDDTLCPTTWMRREDSADSGDVTPGTGDGCGKVG